jgi:hypothetical protein
VGQEVTEAHYRKRDFQAFEQHLAEETTQLLAWVEQGRFSHQWRAGFELEAWLLDADMQPTPKNVEFLEALNDPLVVPELSRFNFELNNDPAPLQGDFLATFQQQLSARWAHCWDAASRIDSSPVLIGTLPTLRAEQLTLENMSPMQRYRALNEQVLRMREGRPLQIAIEGEESLQLAHQDVMFEAATTSLQVHLQAPVEDAARVLNASMILSAPLVAVAANSPFLFGHALWEETRIPVFEQAVALTTDRDPERRYARVGFGSGYVTHGLEAFFVENLESFSPLLPMQFEDVSSLPHVRLHNGTIWRWNRPLLGFDEDGRPHWRIEQRVMSAGPSLIDSMANSALFFGAALSYAAERQPMETRLAFRDARANFYTAARAGLMAQVRVPGGKLASVKDWLLEDLIPRARQALMQVGADAGDWLDVIEARVRTGQTGSAWQRAWVHQHGRDWSGLTAAYLQNQRSDQPVHAWSV